MADGVLRVCALYPDLMNIYADRGNLQLLRKRCEWRGLGFELSGVGLEEPLPDPDVGVHDGWQYLSQPIAVHVLDGAARIERIRSIVAPDGTTTREPDAIELASLDAPTLEREAAAAGLTPLPSRAIPATTDHVGSVVVLARG